ncbi:glycosyltransferase family 2 protein [Pseudokineococcus sp. 1T1Z-3]|uniref:glycosyltransferase family 2 protein n=1 Tax=Pseudokineococcus sp. 1T1Z-3 TaxID=3132745 RepID=UPI00309E93E9
MPSPSEPHAGPLTGPTTGPTTGPLNGPADGEPDAVTVTVLLLVSDTSPEAPQRLRRVLAALAAQTRRPSLVQAVASGCHPGSLEVLQEHGLEPYLRRRSTPAELVRVLPGAPPSGRRRLRGEDGRHKVTGSQAGDGGSSGRGRPGAPDAPDATGTPSLDAPVPWLWLLTDDVVAAPDALERLLAAVELRPGVAVAGPKVRDLDAPGRLLQAGFTTSRRGTALTRVAADELDQGQVDDREDVLAVAGAGMLVRRDVLDEVGGFDPALPLDGADLDLSRRVRMAGHGVVTVPSAVVERPGRHAQVVGGGPASAAYTRLVSASPLGLPFALVGVLLAGAMRALWRFLLKDPGHAPAELGAVVGVVLRPDRLVAARRRAAAVSVRGRSALRPLLASPGEVRRHHRDRWSLRRAAAEVEAEDAARAAEHPRTRPHAPGGLPPRRDPLAALVLVGALLALSVLALRRLLGPGGVVQAPALPPAPAEAATLWAAARSSWSGSGTGVAAPADPLVGVLGALSAPLAGRPGLLVAAVLLLAVPASAAAAWWGAGALTRSRLLRAAGALAWAGGMPLLLGVSTGRLGPVVAHAALPWLARCLLSGYRARSGRRAWAVTGVTALALVVVGVGAPVLLAPALLVLLALAVSARRRLPLLVAGLPVAAVVGPWALAVAARAGEGPTGRAQALGALLGGPVPPVALAQTPLWQQVLAQPLDATGVATDLLGLPSTWPAWLLVGLPLAAAAALAVVALVAAVLRPRAVGGWALVALGTALAAAAASVGAGVVDGGDGAVVAPAWSGPAASTVLLGLLVAAVPLLAGPLGATGPRRPAPDRPGPRAARLAATVVVLALAGGTTGVWTLAQAGTGDEQAAALGLVARGQGPQLPETAAAGAASGPGLRTLVLRPPAAAAGTGADDARAPEAADLPAGVAGADDPPPVTAVLARAGVDLAGTSSLVAASAAAPGEQPADRAAAPVAAAAAALVANDPGARDALAVLAAGFVVLLPPEGALSAAGTDAASALDAVDGLQRAAEVDGAVLWRVAPPPEGTPDVGVLRVLDADGQVQQVVAASARSGSAPLDPGPEGRVLVLAEQADPGWEATLSGEALEPAEAPASSPWAQAFALPADGGQLAVRHVGGWTSPDGPWPWVAGVGLLLAALLAVPLPGRRTA